MDSQRRSFLKTMLYAGLIVPANILVPAYGFPKAQVKQPNMPTINPIDDDMIEVNGWILPNTDLLG